MATHFDTDNEKSRMTQTLDNFIHFLHDRETGKVMGRTAKSWGLILLFYVVYYICLAIFFISMLLVFLVGTVSKDRPSLTGQQSLLKMTPGLGFRPQPDVTNTLIRFDPNNQKTFAVYVQNLKAYLVDYEKINRWENTNIINGGKICSDSTEKFARWNLKKYKDRRICKFPLESLGPNCSSDNGFGYPNGQPCVLLKMNRVFGWLPEILNDSTNNVHIVCQGENPADKENLGKVSYFPSEEVLVNNGSSLEERGVLYSSYFPYLRQTGYLSPLVGVVFNNIKRKVLVMVECQIKNVGNVVIDKMSRLGLVRFEVLVEGSNYS